VVNIKIEPSKVLSTLRVNRQGLNIVLDDQAVKELPEGQDIVAEFQEIRVWSPVRREWDATPKDIQDDGELGVAHTVRPETYELRLRF
jgi:hypothetical protein